MQKRKFDELISHFNRKVSDMSIDQKYKMELLGMISAIGFAHEKELGTNLAEVGTDCISRQAAIDALGEEPPVWYDGEDEIAERNQWKRDIEAIKQLPPIQSDIIRCKDCKHGVLDDGFPHQYFCVFKGDEWNNADYFCGHAKRREVTT